MQIPLSRKTNYTSPSLPHLMNLIGCHLTQCVKEVITVINLFMNSHDYYN